MELILNSYGVSLIKERNNLVVVHQDGKQNIAIPIEISGLIL